MRIATGLTMSLVLAASMAGTEGQPLRLALGATKPPTAHRLESQPSTTPFLGRYAKGVNVLRVEAYGDKLLVLPMWWGGVQALDRKTGGEYEMENDRDAVFAFTKNSLTVVGHRELAGVYKKLDREPAPIELLLTGENESAYQALQKAGLDDAAIVQLVRKCLVNQPSRRDGLYVFIKYLIGKGVRDRSALEVAAYAAVAVRDRAAALSWNRQILARDPFDAGALKLMRLMGQIPTSSGWTLPFQLSDVYSPPTAAEIARVEADWKKRDLQPRDIRKEHQVDLSISGVDVKATAISYLVHGRRNFGVVLVPLGAKQNGLPTLVELKGLSTSYEPLVVPGGTLVPRILDDKVRNFVVFLPGVRGEKLLFDGRTYQCEGDPDDSWDGATDDAISFISAGLDSFPEADPNRIVAFGKSRGGTVAMLLGERDPRVRAIVSWSGPVGWIDNMPQFGLSQFELVREGLSAKAPPSSTPGQVIRTFFAPAIDGRMNLAQVRDRLIASSPIYFVSHLRAGQLHYGANDYTVPTEEGRSMETAVMRLGPRRPDISVIYEEDGGHDLNPRVSVPTTREFLLKYARSIPAGG